MKKVIAIILAISVLTVMVGCEKNEDADYEEDKGVERFLTQDSKILDNIYFENNENAFFYGNIINSVVNDKYDYYSIYWLLGLDNLLEIGLKEKIESWIVPEIETGNICNESNYKYDGIFDIYLRAGVEKYLEYLENDKIYIKQIDRYYDEEQSIFDVGNGNIEEQIQTTNIALKVCLLLGYIPSYKDELRETMLSLCKDSTCFSDTIDLRKDLISRGMIILDNIRMLDLLDGNNSVGDLDGIRAWVKKVTEEYNKYAQEQEGYNVTVLQGNKTICDVTRYLGINIEIQGISDIENIREYFLKDCQIVFQYIERQGKVNVNDLSIYILQNYKYLFYEEKPMYNMKDVYYGMRIYQELGLEFSKEKLVNFLTNYVFHNELSNDDAYFIEKILEDIGCDRETRRKFIIEYGIDNFISDGNMEDNYKYIYYIYKYKIEETTGKVNTIIGLAEKTMDQGKTLSQIYYSLRILEITSTKVDNYMILNRLQEFRNENGYSSAIGSNDVSMYSLYRAKYILEKYDAKERDKIEIRNFAYMLRAPKGGFFIFNDGEEEKLDYNINFTLQAYYYGMLLIE